MGEGAASGDTCAGSGDGTRDVRALCSNRNIGFPETIPWGSRRCLTRTLFKLSVDGGERTKWLTARARLMSLMSLELSDHVRRQAARRGIDDALVRAVAEAPEQVVPQRPGREV